MNSNSILCVLLISVFLIGAAQSYSVGLDSVFDANENYAKDPVDGQYLIEEEDIGETESPTDAPPTDPTSPTPDAPTTPSSATTAVSSLLTVAAAFFLL